MTYPIPPEYERQRSLTVQHRSNAGDTYEEVKRHGRGYVGGSLTERDRSFIGPVLPHQATMSRDRIARALETARVTASGFRDAVDISRLTDAIYPDLPKLIGADTVAYEEAQGENLIGPVRAMARQPRTGDAPLGKIPNNRVADGHVRFDHELLAPTDDGRVFVGHAAIIPRKESERDKRERLAAERESERVELSPRMSLAQALAARATGMRPGESVLWSHKRECGSLSLSPGKRYSATVGGHAIRSQRTVKGLARQVEQLAS
jgi:hypothetical protein